MKKIISVLIVFISVFIVAINFGACADDSVSSSTGKISCENTGQGVKSVLIDGVLYGALTPGQSEVYDGFAPAKYLVEIEGCSAAYVTVIAGETKGLSCGADTEPGK